MQLDPDTACARTAAGEAELQAATHGLALAQRRVLTLLESPRSIASLAAEHRMDVGKLDRDLARLAELKLILLIPQGSEPRSPAPVPAGAGDAIGVGRSLRPARIAAVVGGAAALALAVFVFVGARATLETDARAEARANGGAARSMRATTVAPIVALSAPAVAASQSAATIADDLKPEAETALPAQTVLAQSQSPVPAASALPAPPAPALPIVTATPHGLGLLSGKPAAPAAATPAGHDTLMPALVSANLGTGSPAAAPVAVAPAPASTSAPAPASAPASTSTSAPAPAPALAPATTAGAGVAQGPDPVAAHAPGTPAAQPPVQLALAAPSGPPARATVNTELRALTREPPPFPREAKSAGVTSGTVKARLGLDAKGNVTGVEILQATPPRVFDRAVRSALARWTFEPDSGVSSVEVEVAFKSE